MSTTGYILFGVTLVLILIVQRIAISLVKSASLSERIPADVVNGLSVIVKLLMAILVIYSASIFLSISTDTTIILSVFLGSIVSFASINTIQNLVSGMYILLTEPFSVNDLVKINTTEGVVTEISLNYTSLLNFDGMIQRIPNKKIISSLIINFDQKVKPHVQIEIKDGWFKNLAQSFEDREVTRYVFVWGAPLIDLPTIKQRIDKICKKYIEVFGYSPEYMPYTLNHRFEFSFILKSDSPMTILKNKTHFLDDISSEFH